MWTLSRALACGLVAVLLLWTQGCSKREQPELARETQPGDTTQPQDVVMFGNVALYPREKRIEVGALICTEEGILEYLAVAESGKTYESVLQLDCEPSRLHAALLALGCEPGDVPQEARGDFVEGESFGTGRQNPESYLDIFVEWTEGGKTERVRAEELLLSIADDKCPQATHWVFTGSHFAMDAQGQERYVADVSRSVIAVWYDPSAVINLPVVTGNPYRGPNGFEVNAATLPAVDEVKFIIQPHTEAEEH